MKKFLIDMLSSEQNTSSKRFNGTVGFMIVQLLMVAITVIDLIKDSILSDITSELIQYDLIVSASLLGMAAIEKLWSLKK